MPEGFYNSPLLHVNFLTVIRTQLKKKIILFLLIVASLTSAFLLMKLQVDQTKTMTDLAQADSIIFATFDEFNIHEDQISIETISVDSNFSRKIYNVKVPSNFAESHWHYSIQKKLTEFGIRTPGTVNLRTPSLDIHLYTYDTIFRTIHIQQDTTRYQRYYTAHLFIEFDQIPGQKLIQEVVRLGEPVPIILPLSLILDMDTPKSHIYTSYPRIAYQLFDPFHADGTWGNVDRIAQKLDQLKSIDRTAKLFVFNEILGHLGARDAEKINRTSVQFYDVDTTIQIDADDGRAQFNRELRMAVESAKSGDIPLIIVEGTADALQWLHRYLPEYRKKGLLITNPPLTVL